MAPELTDERPRLPDPADFPGGPLILTDMKAARRVALERLRERVKAARAGEIIQVDPETFDLLKS